MTKINMILARLSVTKYKEFKPFYIIIYESISSSQYQSKFY